MKKAPGAAEARAAPMTVSDLPARWPAQRLSRGTVFLLLIATKAVEVILNSNPRFFLGDSQSYLATAATGWVPPDRSFVYGWLLGGLCRPVHSLLPIVLVQSLGGALAGFLLADAAVRFFRCSPLIGFLGALLFVLDPLQLYFERAIMTESLALLLLVLGLYSLLSYLVSRRLRGLMTAAVLFAALALIRQAFLPVTVVLLAAAPMMALLAGRQPRMSLPAVLRCVAAGGGAAAVLVALLMLYVNALAAWKQLPAKLSRSDGFFLVSYYAPLLEAGDFDEPVRAIAFAPTPFALQRRGAEGFTLQLFVGGGLVDRLRTAYGDQGGNELASRMARTAALKHPFGLLGLAGRTFLDYFDPQRIRSSLHSALGLDRDLPPEMLESLRDRFGLQVAPDYPRRQTFLSRVLEWSWPLHLARLALGLLLACAAVRSLRRSAPLVLLGSMVLLTITSLCLLTIMDIRYLHSFSWMSALTIALAAQRLSATAGGRRAIAAMNRASAKLAAGLEAAMRKPGLLPVGSSIVALAAVLLVAFKLWLTRGQGLLAIGDSPGDDRLYLEMADKLLSGDWLGPYWVGTLVKNPGFPLWVAAMFKADIPLLLSCQLLYAAACWAVVAAVRPALPHRAWGWGLFVLLLWNPITFSQVATRASREGIYPALALLVFAGCAGVVTRLGASTVRLGRWSALLGISLAALLITREEGIWIAPMMAVTLLAAARRGAPWKRLAGALAGAGVLCLVLVGAVLAKNWSRYGLPILNEQSQGAFPVAWGALSRVRHAHWRRYVPLPTETREQLYAVSPAFAELAPQLEGPRHAGWVAASCRVAGICDEVYSGLAFWEVRDAARLAGHITSGRESSRFWTSIAAQVNGACDRHSLDCGPPSTSMAPPWRSEYAPIWLASVRSGLRFVTGFETLSARPAPTGGPLELTTLFRDLTHERLSGLESARRVLAIRGWALSEDGRALDLRVVGAGSEPVGDAPARAARPDVEEHFRDKGFSRPPPSGFFLRAYCPGECEVSIRSGEVELARVTAQAGRVVDQGGVHAAIDGASVDGALLHQEQLDSSRVSFLEHVVALYRFAGPALCWLALTAWLAALLAIRGPGGLRLFLLAAGAGVGAATRICLLALVDAVAFPGINSGYLSAAYPLVLVFVSLGGAAAAAAFAQRTPRRSPATLRSPQVTRSQTTDSEPDPS